MSENNMEEQIKELKKQVADLRAIIYDSKVFSIPKGKYILGKEQERRLIDLTTIINKVLKTEESIEVLKSVGKIMYHAITSIRDKIGREELPTHNYTKLNDYFEGIDTVAYYENKFGKSIKLDYTKENPEVEFQGPEDLTRNLQEITIDSKTIMNAIEYQNSALWYIANSLKLLGIWDGNQLLIFEKHIKGHLELSHRAKRFLKNTSENDLKEFLKNETDLYSIEDLKVKYKSENVLKFKLLINLTHIMHKRYQIRKKLELNKV